MSNDLSNYRKSYEKGELLIKDVPNTPIQLFQDWFDEVDTHFPDQETNAMSLSTIGLDGFPRNRIVLLKHYTENGFIFYTNYESKKGKAIINTPNVCLSFFWQEAERQVIIKGIAEKIAEDISDTYFKSRPRGSKIGAHVSNQSQAVSKQELENKLKQLEVFYKDKEIPRPKHWGGFLVKPIEIEFWQGRPNRLHDRISYKLDTDHRWNVTRLAP